MGGPGFDPWVGKDPWKKGMATPQYSFWRIVPGRSPVGFGLDDLIISFCALLAPIFSIDVY